MDPEQGLKLAKAALQACGQLMRSAQLTGSLALHARNILTRCMSDVNLSTPYSFAPSLILPEIAREVQRSGFEVRLHRPQSATHVELTARNPDGGDIRVTLTQLPQSRKSEIIEGIPVSGVVDCLNRTLQALRGREEAKDYIDVAALESHLKPAKFDEIVKEILDTEVRCTGVAPHKPHLALYNRLAQIIRIPRNDLNALSVSLPASGRTTPSGQPIFRWAPGSSHSLFPSGWRGEDIANRVTDMTARVLANSPVPPLQTGQLPPRALLDADPAKLAELRLALVVAEFDSHFSGRIELPSHWRLSKFVAGFSAENLRPEITRIEAELVRRPPHPQPPIVPPTPPPGPSPR
ncbi:hypothetical protein [Streptomyces rhizosphaericus]|uniref:hypothetical protein n=1 Tax=Streptomyces rhizosphaericus TaxID=114699 RepID=UPI00117F06B3|nr:hypothetical protein [Streptomyces rhizosphaericus]